MELKSYFNVLIKRLWLIIIIPLFAAAATAAVSLYVLDPVYESSITLYIMNKDSDSGLAYDDFLVSQQLIKDCRELIKSKSITKAVIEQLDLEDITEKELAERISVNMKNDTRLLEIKVRDTSKERAKAIADEISIIFQRRINELINLEILDVIDEAEIPDEPIFPKPLASSAIAFSIFLFLIICIAFIVDYFDDTLKNLEDIEKLLGIKVIAIIPSLDIK